MKNLLTVKKHANKGITLIALIITIIVLLILAGVSIAMLTGENGILTQAQKAKLDSKEGEEREQIGLAFNSAKMKKLEEGDSSDITATELEEELNCNGIADVEVTGTGTLTVEMPSGNEYTVTQKGVIASTGSSEETLEPEEYEGLTITPETEGIISYTDKNGNPKQLTDEIEDGDILIYGDYEYRYNEGGKYDGICDDLYWQDYPDQNAWGVMAIRNAENYDKSEFGELCGTILGKRVTNFIGLFYSLFGELTIAPEIPIFAQDIERAFEGCSSLISVTIPSSISSIRYTFKSCKSLESVTIPDSVTRISNGDFYGCTSLENIIYEGTTEQWGRITLESKWDIDVKATTVQCSDGTVNI